MAPRRLQVAMACRPATPAPMTSTRRPVGVRIDRSEPTWPARAGLLKPVTSVAVLMLLEEGKLSLDDPLARYLPEFADRTVVTGGDLHHPQTEDAPRAITLRHLLTHTSGFAAASDTHRVATKLFKASLPVSIWVLP